MSEQRWYDLDFTTDVEPLKVVVTPPTDPYDPLVMAIEVTLSGEGFVFDYYEDGELVRTSAQTWQEWIESGLYAPLITRGSNGSI